MLVAATVATLVVARPGPSAQRIATLPQTTSAGPSPSAVRAAAAAEMGERPGLITAVSRTTPDGLRLKVALVDSSKDPRSSFMRTIPAECVDVESADSVAQLPHSGFGFNAATIPTLEPGTVSISGYPLGQGDAATFRTLANGEVDPRTVVDPLPGAEPEPPDPSGAIGTVALVRGDDSLRHARVVFPGGVVDESEVTDGFAALAVRATGQESSPWSGALAMATLTFADGHSIEVDLTTRNSAVVGPDGSDRPTVSQAAWTAGSCAPQPPSLPDAGPGPANEDEALAAVTATVETAANGALPIDERLTAFVDRDRGRRIVEELGAANIAGAANSSATVRGVVFISPTEAVMQFDLSLPPDINGQQIPSSMVQGVFGKVVLVGDEWLITSESICKLVGSVTPTACRGLQVSEYPPEVYFVPR